jgi:hypothetical protein
MKLVGALALGWACSPSASSAQGRCLARLELHCGSPVHEPEVACRVDPAEADTMRLSVRVEAHQGGALPGEHLALLKVHALRRDSPVAGRVLARDPGAHAALDEYGTPLQAEGEPRIGESQGLTYVIQDFTWPGGLPSGDYWAMAAVPPPTGPSCAGASWSWSASERISSGPLDPVEKALVAFTAAQRTERSGRLDDAIDEYLRAAALSPHALEARVRAAELLLERGRTAVARVEAQRVLDGLGVVIDPESASQLRGRAMTVLRH